MPILKDFIYISYQQITMENYFYSHYSTVDNNVDKLLTYYPQLNFVEKCGKLHIMPIQWAVENF